MNWGHALCSFQTRIYVIREGNIMNPVNKYVCALEKQKGNVVNFWSFLNPKYKTDFSSIQSRLPLDKNGSEVVSERVVISCPTRGLLSPPSNIPKTFTL